MGSLHNLDRMLGRSASELSALSSDRRGYHRRRSAILSVSVSDSGLQQTESLVTVSVRFWTRLCTRMCSTRLHTMRNETTYVAVTAVRTGPQSRSKRVCDEVGLCFAVEIAPPSRTSQPRSTVYRSLGSIMGSMWRGEFAPPDRCSSRH